MKNGLFPAAAMAVLTFAYPAMAQRQGGSAVDSTGSISADAAPPAPPFAFVADLAIAAPLILDVTVRSTATIKPKEAPDLNPGLVRLYVTADVNALVRGRGGVPPRIGYLVDLRPDGSGHAPKLKKARLLLFARAVPNAPDQLQLVSPDAQIAWSPAADAVSRRIVRGLVAADAPPVVTGVGKAFHVPGSLPGESESQVFLSTADGRPVSLSILRRPGERTRWALALSEIVDEAAQPPARDTLLWYRLACFLPRELPDASVAQLTPPDADAAREDYRFVIGELGRCGLRALIGEAPISGGGAPR
jgi:hypothetical protein